MAIILIENINLLSIFYFKIVWQKTRTTFSPI